MAMFMPEYATLNNTTAMQICQQQIVPALLQVPAAFVATCINHNCQRYVIGANSCSASSRQACHSQSLACLCQNPATMAEQTV